MNSQIHAAIKKLFEDSRIVLWKDPTKEFIEDWKGFEAKEISCICVDNDEFSTKVRVLVQEPDQKFLLYLPYPEKENRDNWLLDLELRSPVFFADKISTWLQELEWPIKLRDFIHAHRLFFENKQRRAKLKLRIRDSHSETQIRQHLIAITLGSDTEQAVDMALEILKGVAERQEESQLHKLQKYGLIDDVWALLEQSFSYNATQPSLYGFILHLFKSASSLWEDSASTAESHILFSRAQDSQHYRQYFEEVSHKVSKDLNVPSLFQQSSLEKVGDRGLFEFVESWVIALMTKELCQEQPRLVLVDSVIENRLASYWYKKYEPHYHFLSYVQQLFTFIDAYQDKAIASATEGMERYLDKYWKVDYYYRKAILAYLNTEGQHDFDLLKQRLEKKYLYYQQKGATSWQRVVDQMPSWQWEGKMAQRNFFKYCVQPYLDRDQRILVIVSDALRYEVGVELAELLQESGSFHKVVIDGAASQLPSYTQLGMAALMPHHSLSWKGESDSVAVDEMSSSGIEGRKNILRKKHPMASAMQAADFMALRREEGRKLLQERPLVYVYSNTIDRVGDNKNTERQVFQAVESEIQLLKSIVEKATNRFNTSNIIITADHGFLYQHEALSTADFLNTEQEGTIWKKNRRFIIGTDLNTEGPFNHFTASQLQIDGVGEVLLPKGLTRIRVKGAGSQFVHGGSSLQEVAIPILQLNRQRSKGKVERRKVEVDLLQSRSQITTYTIALSFIQKEPVDIGNQILPRELRMGFYSKDGILLSSHFRYIFDSDQEDMREREVKHAFSLSNQLQKYTGEDIELRLEEPIAEAMGEYVRYKSFSFKANVSLGNDFDGF